MKDNQLMIRILEIVLKLMNLILIPFAKINVVSLRAGADQPPSCFFYHLSPVELKDL